MIQKLDVSKAIVEYMMPYSKHVITERAIIDVRDGLKPSQRMGIWAMYDAGAFPNKKRMKSVGVSGLMLKYHPHSDQSAYETLSRLAQNDSLLHPLIDPKGNMGQRTSRDISASASRYTEMRLSEFSMEMFEGINKNGVNMEDNFDGSLKQPEVFPVDFPTSLVYGSSGIAVGFSSNIPSFNLSEVCQYTINLLRNKENSLLVPDFATGGEILYKKDELEKVDSLGEGKFLIRAKWEVEGNTIIVKEIPYTTTREAIIDRIVQLVKEGKLKELTDVRDGTGLSGMKIEIELKKGSNPTEIMAKLFKMTPLESSFSCNMNVIYKDKPVKMGVKNIVEAWIDFRKETVKRITDFDIKKYKKELKTLYALQKILLDIDKTIEIIKKSEDDKETIHQLMTVFEIDKEEAETVSNYKLRNLNKSYITSKLNNIEELERKVEALEDLLMSDEDVISSIIKDLKNIIAKYGKERMTSIVYKDSLANIDVLSLTEPEDYNLKVFVTEDLYLKKIPLTSMRGKFTNRLKEDDSFTIEQELTNTGEVIVFTDKHNVYKKRLSDITDTRPSDLGEYIPSLFDYEKDEKPLFAIPLDKEFNQTLILGFDDGTVAKINTSAYYTKQNRQLLKKGYANKNLIYVFYGEGLEHLQANSSDGYTVVREMSTFGAKDGRSSNGNNFMRLNDGVNVVEYSVPTEEQVEKYLIKTAGRGKK